MANELLRFHLKANAPGGSINGIRATKKKTVIGVVFHINLQPCTFPLNNFLKLISHLKCVWLPPIKEKMVTKGKGRTERNSNGIPICRFYTLAWSFYSDILGTLACLGRMMPFRLILA